jgi:hypothetical protein
MPDILINFFVPDCTEQEARNEVYNLLPFDPDSDRSHKVESWVEVKPEIQYPPFEAQA